MPIPMSTSFRCLKSHHQDNQRQVSAQGKERRFFKKKLGKGSLQVSKLPVIRAMQVGSVRQPAALGCVSVEGIGRLQVVGRSYNRFHAIWRPAVQMALWESCTRDPGPEGDRRSWGPGSHVRWGGILDKVWGLYFTRKETAAHRDMEACLGCRAVDGRQDPRPPAASP